MGLSREELFRHRDNLVPVAAHRGQLPGEGLLEASGTDPDRGRGVRRSAGSHRSGMRRGGGPGTSVRKPGVSPPIAADACASPGSRSAPIVPGTRHALPTSRASSMHEGLCTTCPARGVPGRFGAADQARVPIARPIRPSPLMFLRGHFHGASTCRISVQHCAAYRIDVPQLAGRVLD